MPRPGLACWLSGLVASGDAAFRALPTGGPAPVTERTPLTTAALSRAVPAADGQAAARRVGRSRRPDRAAPEGGPRHRRHGWLRRRRLIHRRRRQPDATRLRDMSPRERRQLLTRGHSPTAGVDLWPARWVTAQELRLS